MKFSSYIYTRKLHKSDLQLPSSVSETLKSIHGFIMQERMFIKVQIVQEKALRRSVKLLLNYLIKAINTSAYREMVMIHPCYYGYVFFFSQHLYIVFCYCKQLWNKAFSNIHMLVVFDSINVAGIPGDWSFYTHPKFVLLTWHSNLSIYLQSVFAGIDYLEKENIVIDSLHGFTFENYF